jgi:hypothetical protein
MQRVLILFSPEVWLFRRKYAYRDLEDLTIAVPSDSRLALATLQVARSKLGAVIGKVPAGPGIATRDDRLTQTAPPEIEDALEGG